MSIKSQRQALQTHIVARLRAVSGVSNVYTEYQRASSMSVVLDKFAASSAEGDDTILQYWTVRRVGADLHTAENDPRVPRRVGLNTYLTFELKLFCGYREGVTEDIFQDLIDDVLDGFKEDRSLGQWTSTGPLSLHNNITDGYDKMIYWHQCVFRVTAIIQETDLNPSNVMDP